MNLTLRLQAFFMEIILKDIAVMVKRLATNIPAPTAV